MSHRLFAALAAVLATCAVGVTPASAALPQGFQAIDLHTGFSKSVGLAVAGDGRVFVAEQRGMVWVWHEGQVNLFIDLRSEVGFGGDRGLLGIALDPDFTTNHTVYLLYVVDPIPGDPDEPSDQGTSARLTRYTGTAASNGSVADPASRTVLLGDPLSEGIPCCWPSHSVGSLAFGYDGSLFVTAGDGASFNYADAGGTDPECFGGELFGLEEDLGAFRSQSLLSLGGKVLRLDPETGGGLPDNPWFSGDPAEKQSKIWAYGLRNPFRIALRPGSPPPGTLYISDVGWNTYEEINVCHGGENFGWPCYEGPLPMNDYQNLEPPASGCDTIGAPENPAPLRMPLAWWHHGAGSLSFPPGLTGNCAIASAFYAGTKYPPQYQGAFFMSDFIKNWVKVLKVDARDNYVAYADFATLIGGAVDFESDPLTGDLIYVTTLGKLRRLIYAGADLNSDGQVNGADLALLLAHWGSPGTGDLDGNGVVDGVDLGILLANWTV